MSGDPSFRHGVTRRGFLTVAVSAIVAGVVAGAGAYYAGSVAAPVKEVTKTVTTTVITTKTVTAPPEKPPRTIKIGTSASLTGPFWPYGLTKEKTLKFGAEYINEKYGGIYLREYGRTLPIEVIVYDDKSDVETMVKNTEKLIVEDRVDGLIGVFLAEPSLVVSTTVIEKYGVPTVSECDAVHTLKPDLNWVVPGAVSNMDLWYYSGLELLSRKGAKSVAFIYDAGPGFASSTSEPAIKKWSPKFGMKVVLDEPVPPEMKEWSPILTKLKDKNPDVLCVCSVYPVTHQTLYKQLLETAWRPRMLFATPPASFVPALKTAGLKIPNYFTGVLESWHRSLPFEGPWGKQIWLEMMEKTGLTIEDYLHLGNDWCAFEVLLKAIEIAGTLDKNKINQVLHSAEFMTTAGPWKGYQRDGRGGGPSMSQAVQWVNGKYEIVNWPERPDPGPYVRQARPDLITAEYVYPMPWE
jgi:branched-chain amino acid transport system substrate-binding protein